MMHITRLEEKCLDEVIWVTRPTSLSLTFVAVLSTRLFISINPQKVRASVKKEFWNRKYAESVSEEVEYASF